LAFSFNAAFRRPGYEIRSLTGVLFDLKMLKTANLKLTQYLK